MEFKHLTQEKILMPLCPRSVVGVRPSSLFISFTYSWWHSKYLPYSLLDHFSCGNPVIGVVLFPTTCFNSSPIATQNFSFKKKKKLLPLSSLLHPCPLHLPHNQSHPKHHHPMLYGYTISPNIPFIQITKSTQDLINFNQLPLFLLLYTPLFSGFFF